LLPARALHGIGLALFTTAGLTIVTDLVDSSRWGEATGLFLSAQLLAIALAPAFGTLFAGAEGLVSLVPFAVAIALLSFVAAGLIKTSYTKQPAENDSILKINYRMNDFRVLLSPSLAAVAVGIGYATVITFLPLVAIQNNMNGASLFYFIYALVALVVRTPAGRIR
jgi:MFS family permease